MACRWVFLLLVIAALGLQARETHPAGLSTIGDTAHIDINQIDLGLENNGHTGLDGDSYFPKGTPLTFLFGGGLALSGYVNGELRTAWMAPSDRIIELQAGKLGMDPADSLARFYRVDRADGPGSPNYLDWAAAVALGADFVDVNGDGLYDPFVDHPDKMGDRTLWCVYNDSTPPSQRTPRLGTPPLGIEIQQTVWAFHNLPAFQKTIFFRYRLINAGGHPIDSLIFSFWADPDVGDFNDDLVGCDTTLQLGYCYNDGLDNQYGMRVPAFGFALLQGPVVPATGDTARVFLSPHRGFKIIPDARNLPMTSFIENVSSDPVFGGPTNAQQARWYQQGGRDRSGNPINPQLWGTGGTAATNPLFLFSGDPVTGTGWLDNVPGDKRILVNSGPFFLAPGDTQDVIGAYVVGFKGDNLTAVTDLRREVALSLKAFRKTRFVDIRSSNPFLALGRTDTLKATGFHLLLAEEPMGGQWTLLQRPSGSSAQLVVPAPGLQALLTPDVAGQYRIALQATFSNGETASDTLDIEAIDNAPPAVNWQLTPQKPEVFEPLTFDASPTTDPDGDTLQFQWWISGPGGPLQSTDPVFNFTPQHIGAYYFVLSVEDGFFSVERDTTIFVGENTNNFQRVDENQSITQISDLRLNQSAVYVLEGSVNRFSVLSRDSLGQVLASTAVNGTTFFKRDSLLITAHPASGYWIYRLDSAYQATLLAHLAATPAFSNGENVDPPYLLDQTLYLVDGQALKAYDITDPANPLLLGQLNRAFPIKAVAYQGTLAVLAARAEKPVLVDLSDPQAMVVVDSLEALPIVPGVNAELAMDSALIYVARANSTQPIYVMDASTPGNTVLVGQIPVSQVNRLVAQGRFLTVHRSQRVDVYDFNDPTQPVHVGWVRADAPLGAALYVPEHLYAGFLSGSSGFNGLFAYRHSPGPVGIQPLPQADVVRAFELRPAYPNPFNPSTTIPFAVPRPARVEIAVYNVLGQRVSTLFSGSVNSGVYRVNWNGQTAASGVYFVRMVAEASGGNGRPFVQVRKVLLLR